MFLKPFPRIHPIWFFWSGTEILTYSMLLRARSTSSAQGPETRTMRLLGSSGGARWRTSTATPKLWMMRSRFCPPLPMTWPKRLSSTPNSMRVSLVRASHSAISSSKRATRSPQRWISPWCRRCTSVRSFRPNSTLRSSPTRTTAVPVPAVAGPDTLCTEALRRPARMRTWPKQPTASSDSTQVVNCFATFTTSRRKRGPSRADSLLARRI
mmetsp:Transcript_45860/g.99982  ORF Transcript_45860/g.99982 Transcript_45860/m.99982 type:complete len:211 (-) Transcript_45860:98-730(-)